MIKKSGLVLGFLVLSLTSCEEAPVTYSEDHAAETHRSCTPSFREIADEPVGSNNGTLDILFSVALIGCKESLQTLNQAELRTITSEFNEPSEWSNFQLYADAMKLEFREKATARVNFLVERQVATDILVHSLSIIDYGPRLDGQ